MKKAALKRPFFMRKRTTSKAQPGILPATHHVISSIAPGGATGLQSADDVGRGESGDNKCNIRKRAKHFHINLPDNHFTLPQQPGVKLTNSKVMMP
jgi:hypothetical protein